MLSSIFATLQYDWSIDLPSGNGLADAIIIYLQV